MSQVGDDDWTSPFGTDCSGLVNKIWQLPYSWHIEQETPEEETLPEILRYWTWIYACMGDDIPIPTYPSGTPFWTREVAGLLSMKVPLEVVVGSAPGWSTTTARSSTNARCSERGWRRIATRTR